MFDSTYSITYNFKYIKKDKLHIDELTKSIFRLEFLTSCLTPALITTPMPNSPTRRPAKFSKR